MSVMGHVEKLKEWLIFFLELLYTRPPHSLTFFLLVPGSIQRLTALLMSNACIFSPYIPKLESELIHCLARLADL